MWKKGKISSLASKTIEKVQLRIKSRKEKKMKICKIEVEHLGILIIALRSM